MTMSTATSKSGKAPIGLPEQINAFMNLAPVEMQRTLILALHTGQRQGDLRKLVWTNYDGKFTSLRQNKGSQRVTVACTGTLKRMLDAMPRTSAVLLATKTGRPWSERYFKAQRETASKTAGIEDLHFHHLRNTAVTLLADAGCTVPEIESITGHSPKSVYGIMEKYMARTGALASAAIEKFENAMSTDFANH